MSKILTPKEAVSLLKEKNDAVIAYPTETFYGLGTRASSERGISKIFRLKGRDLKKPFALLVSSTDMLRSLVVDIPLNAQKLIESFWPGPLTLVLAAKTDLSPLLIGEEKKVAARISSHPMAQEIVQGIEEPITTTSANRSGERPAEAVSQVEEDFGDELDGIVDGGNLRGGLGSTVVSVEGGTWSILREGRISSNAIKKLLLSDQGWDSV